MIKHTALHVFEFNRFNKTTKFFLTIENSKMMMMHKMMEITFLSLNFVFECITHLLISVKCNLYFNLI